MRRSGARRPPDRHGRPPGEALRSLLAPLLDTRISERILDPIVADLQTTWPETSGKLARAHVYLRFLGDLIAAFVPLALAATLAHVARRSGPCLAGASIAAATFVGMQTAISLPGSADRLRTGRPVAHVDPFSGTGRHRSARAERCDELRSWIDHPTLPARARRMAARAARDCGSTDSTSTPG